jgi:uncharacterized MAPEG superfamily protein
MKTCRINPTGRQAGAAGHLERGDILTMDQLIAIVVLIFVACVAGEIIIHVSNPAWAWVFAAVIYFVWHNLFARG